MHNQASGAKIYKESYDSFLAEAYAKLDKIDFDNQLYTVEAIVPCRPFNETLGKLFAQEDIWNSTIEKPLMRITGIDCIGASFMGTEGQHVKISTPKINVVIFNDEELVNTLKNSKNYTMNVVGSISWDEWEEHPKLQIIVDGYELEEKKDTGWTIYDF